MKAGCLSALQLNIVKAHSVSAFYLYSYRVLKDSMLIVRDDAFCGKKTLVQTETNHPVQLALNRSRRGNCADKTQI